MNIIVPTCRFKVVACILLAAVPSISLAASDELGAQAAMKIIEGCQAHAKSRSHSHAIAVYDEGGHPIALLRMDGNPAGVMDFAMQKAAAVAHWQFSTAEMEISVKQTPGFGNAPNVVTVAGGVPVFSADGHFIGAVGVSGEAPKDDAECAEAGVKAGGFSTRRTPMK